MRVEYINPFIVALTRVFESTVGITPRRSDLGIKEGNVSTHDVSAIIGLSGNAFGSVVLSFPQSTACKVVSAMVGENDPTKDHIADGVGELVNMVAGMAKGLLAGSGIKTFIAIPRVIFGLGHFIHRPKGVPCVMVRFETEMGNLVLEVALKVLQKTSSSSSQAVN